MSRDRAVELWRDRRDWFFKPADGYGSKAVYRGDKITRTAFSALLDEGGYIAQRYAPPGRRTIKRDDDEAICKADVRLYAYGGEPLLLAARLYQGQVTNFRTPVAASPRFTWCDDGKQIPRSKPLPHWRNPRVWMPSSFWCGMSPMAYRQARLPAGSRCRKTPCRATSRFLSAQD